MPVPFAGDRPRVTAQGFSIMGRDSSRTAEYRSRLLLLVAILGMLTTFLWIPKIPSRIPFWILDSFDTTPIPPSLDVRNIPGPIEFVGGDTSSHDGTWAFRFKDARGVGREVRLVEGAEHVVISDGEKERQLHMCGPQEKWLLGILARWVEADPRARELDRRAEIRWDGEGEEVGVAIYRTLRRRNASVD